MGQNIGGRLKVAVVDACGLRKTKGLEATIHDPKIFHVNLGRAQPFLAPPRAQEITINHYKDPY